MGSIRDPRYRIRKEKTYPGSRTHKRHRIPDLDGQRNKLFLPCLAWQRTTESSAEDRGAASEPRLETRPSFSVNKPSVFSTYTYNTYINFLFEKITMQSSSGKKYFLFIAMKIFVSTAGWTIFSHMIKETVCFVQLVYGGLHMSF